MPGIHVHSLGKLDWIERGNNPVLTIPGAYWLCHKKHIYKFTFKWHKSLRNTQGFAYPKELTKVIRRIIKSQPKQGQQFGTRHLLVTYKHSPWIRQDKMFAMLKFRERTEATAFPHAFILTVQTLDDSSSERPTHEISDDYVVETEEVNNRRTSRSDAQGQKSRRTSRGDAQGTKNLDRRESEKKVEARKVANDKPNLSGDSPLTLTSLREPDVTRKKDGSKRSSRSRREPDKDKNKSPSNSQNDERIGTDFADLPYQYIIEKEIENSKASPEKSSTVQFASSPGPSAKESDLPGKSSSRSPKAAHVEIPRSADITDLVMEGLMFTIRQDQDQVRVVEQKTKLEMDEVLENSEKIETKEGEKCLVNSSLLRLENLITKIELSEAGLRANRDTTGTPSPNVNTSMTNKSFAFNFSDNIVEPRSDVPYIRSSQPYIQSPIFDAHKPPLVKINLNNVRAVLSDRLEYDEINENTKTAATRDVSMDLHVVEGKRDEMDDFAEDIEEDEDDGLELKFDDEKEDSDDETIEVNNVEEQKDIRSEVSQSEKNENLLSKDCEAHKSQITDGSGHLNSGPKSKCAPRIISTEIVTLNLNRLKRIKLSNENENNEVTAPNRTDENNMFDEKTSQTLQLKDHQAQLFATPSSSSTPLEDDAQDFEQEFTSEKTRKQPIRRIQRHAEESLSNTNQSSNEDPEVRLNLCKFMQDITRGAKVVVQRLDLANIPKSFISSSSLLKLNANR